MSNELFFHGNLFLINLITEPPRVAAAVGPRGKRVQTPQQTRTPPAPLPAALPEVPREQTAALAHAAKGVEALGVLVQYLVFRVSFRFYSFHKIKVFAFASVILTNYLLAIVVAKNEKKRRQIS